MAVLQTPAPPSWPRLLGLTSFATDLPLFIHQRSVTGWVRRSPSTTTTTTFPYSGQDTEITGFVSQSFILSYKALNID